MRSHIIALRIIVEKTLELNKEIMITFVDIEKAFDNHNWNIMFRVLRDEKVDYRGGRIIVQLYTNKRALISRNGLEAKR